MKLYYGARPVQRMMKAGVQVRPELEPPRPFITTWQTTTANESITIPTTGVGYDFRIDWWDGTTVETNTTGNPSHTYAEPGIHTVQISGNFPRILFNLEGDKEKILTIEQRGDVEWTSMSDAFRGASNLAVVAIDVPQFNTVSSVDFSNMFMAATNLTGNFNHWDTSKVTNMQSMFYEASSFNQPIGNRDTGNVTNMGGMFNNASSFNQSLSWWDTSKVTNMNSMFNGASSFNQDLSSRCVLDIPYKPSFFDDSTPSWIKEWRQPVWGTCPDQL